MILSGFFLKLIAYFAGSCDLVCNTAGLKILSSKLSYSESKVLDHHLDLNRVLFKELVKIVGIDVLNHGAVLVDNCCSCTGNITEHTYLTEEVIKIKLCKKSLLICAIACIYSYAAGMNIIHALSDLTLLKEHIALAKGLNLFGKALIMVGLCCLADGLSTDLVLL